MKKILCILFSSLVLFAASGGQADKEVLEAMNGYGTR